MRLKIEASGLDDLLEFFESKIEKADNVAKAANGKNDIDRTRAELKLVGRPRLMPLMSSEHAKMIQSGQATEKEIYMLYWTIDDITAYLTED